MTLKPHMLGIAMERAGPVIPSVSRALAPIVDQTAMASVPETRTLDDAVDLGSAVLAIAVLSIGVGLLNRSFPPDPAADLVRDLSDMIREGAIRDDDGSVERERARAIEAIREATKQRR